MNPVKSVDKVCAVLAGAGTGKTFTIIEKLKHLIAGGIYKPEKVVCLTFSNEAVGNILTRVRKELDIGSDDVIGKNDSGVVDSESGEVGSGVVSGEQELGGDSVVGGDKEEGDSGREGENVNSKDDSKVVDSESDEVGDEKVCDNSKVGNEIKDGLNDNSEMVDRAGGKVVGGQEPIVRTFHGFSADLLREHGEKIGIGKDFVILEPNQAKVLLHSYFGISPFYCHKYIGSIGVAKDLGIGIEEVVGYVDSKLAGRGVEEVEKRMEDLSFLLQTLHPRGNVVSRKKLKEEIKELNEIVQLKKFVNAWGAYEKIKKMKNFQDYSDLNYNALELLRRAPAIAHNYDYIIVDEFQDTNKVQLDMIFFLGLKNNVTIVGDLNQSIYRFRGAYKENFNEFLKHFNIDRSEICALDKSFRSSNKILRTAHKLILNNYSNKEDCFEVKNFENREGKNVCVWEMKNGREEARKVVELVEEEIERGVDMNEICVLFRTHQQGRVIKNLMESKGIPFCSVSKGSLLKQKSVKTLIDYLVITDRLGKRKKGGEQAWWDLMYNLGLGSKDLIKIGKLIKERKKEECLSEVLVEELESLDLSDRGRFAVKIMLERIGKLVENYEKGAEELVDKVMRYVFVNDDSKESREISLNLNKFRDFVKEHQGLYGNDLENFLHYLKLMEKLDIELEPAEIEKKGVRLMTLHATKGLEFDSVIVTNMAQRRFPIVRGDKSSLIPYELYPNSDNSVDEKQHQLFEERRLCYVAFTRARKRLFLTYSKEYGGRKFYPSQFLNEVGFKNNKDIKFESDNYDRYEIPAEKRKIKLEIGEVEEKSEEEIGSEVKRITFSPSALLCFNDCQKKYEYKYVYNMPDEEIVNWEAVKLGNFVHEVLDYGVRGGFVELKEFVDYARELYSKEEWDDIDFDVARRMIGVFYARNKKKYSSSSETEQYLSAELGGFLFRGFADRIDYNPDGIEIVDYKTGRSKVAPLNRNWQLGFYALALSSKGKVKRITLDMLQHEKAVEFEVDENGNAVAMNSDRIEGFNIFEIKDELIREAEKIVNAYKNGFEPCPPDSGCKFCGEYVWGN